MMKSSDNESDLSESGAESKALRSELTSWSASSVQELTRAEKKRRFMFSNPPDLGCVVCKKDIDDTPVYQADHLACNYCSQKDHSCPECSKAISRIKNVAVGNIIHSLLVSCKFAGLGCKEMMAFTASRSDHEDICDFAPINRLMPDCNQAGVKNRLHDHLADKHNINSVVDLCSKYWRDDGAYGSHSETFDLDSSTTSVLSRHQDSKEFHLLHQESTPLGDRLQITALAKSSKRGYQVNVEIDEGQTYCYKSTSTSVTPQRGGLVIPKLPDGVSSAKKHCKIRMNV